jgi:hypothetical protein
MKRAALERWEATRARGRNHFVIFTGLLSYGLPMFLVMTFLVHRDKLSVFFVSASLILWLFGGVAFGILVWLFQERQYRKHSLRPRADYEQD